jgi:hypothetical protein
LILKKTGKTLAKAIIFVVNRKLTHKTEKSLWVKRIENKSEILRGVKEKIHTLPV